MSDAQKPKMINVKQWHYMQYECVMTSSAVNDLFEGEKLSLLFLLFFFLCYMKYWKLLLLALICVLLLTK